MAYFVLSIKTDRKMTKKNMKNPQKLLKLKKTAIFFAGKRFYSLKKLI